jgi:hypothetical protein
MTIVDVIVLADAAAAHQRDQRARHVIEHGYPRYALGSSTLRRDDPPDQVIAFRRGDQFKREILFNSAISAQNSLTNGTG